jgi:glycosyltransferase involved in cell wall biosynthesis
LETLKINGDFMNGLKLLLIGASVFQRDECGRLTSKRLVVNYVQGFTKWFDEVIWATSLFKGKTHTRAVINTELVRPYILDTRPQGLLSAYRTLRQLIDQHTVIFLHLPNPWITPIILLLKKKARGFFVYIANDYIQHSKVSRQSRGWVYAWLYRFVHELPIRLADGVVARGKLNFERALKLNSNVIETVPIGLNTVYYKRIKEPFSGNSIKILYVGKLMEGKGVDVLLQAFSKLCNGVYGKALSLIIVGTGPEEDKLKRMSFALGVAEKVRFIGFVDDEQKLSAIYADSDVLVVPSTSYPEAVPRVIDEAILHGTPVVASDLESIRRQFSIEKVILVRPGDINALADVIFRLIDDHGFRKSIIEKPIGEGKWQDASEQHANFILSKRGRW